MGFKLIIIATLQTDKFETNRAFANLLNIIPLLKNTDNDAQNGDHLILMELYERNLSVINGSDIEIIVNDNNIDEN